MFDKFTNKENLNKIWKRTKDVAKVIGDEASESFKNMKEKVKEKSEDWDDLEAPSDNLKSEEAKAEDVKVEEAKVEEAKVEDVKVEDVKVEEAKVEEAKVEDVKVEDVKVEDK